jgi:Luciferase-like monooxygenase
MKFSLSLPVFHEPGRRDPYAATFALAGLAERSGYDTLTLSHHHFMAGWPSDPLLLLGAVAARTERIRVGTNIFLLSIDHPLQVAERVATLDQLSGGRVTLGVGSGWGEPTTTTCTSTTPTTKGPVPDMLVLSEACCRGPGWQRWLPTVRKWTTLSSGCWAESSPRR